jgi:hypothetical protein
MNADGLSLSAFLIFKRITLELALRNRIAVFARINHEFGAARSNLVSWDRFAPHPSIAGARDDVKIISVCF